MSEADRKIWNHVRSMMASDRIGALAIAAQHAAGRPGSPHAQATHGYALFRCSKFAEARAAYLRAADLVPDPAYFLTLARLERKLGDYQASLSRAATALTLCAGLNHPERVRIKAFTANAAHLLGDRSFAEWLTADDKEVFQAAVMSFAAWYSAGRNPDRRRQIAAAMLTGKIPVGTEISFWNNSDFHQMRELDDKANLTRLLRTDPAGSPPWYPETYIWPDESSAAETAVAKGDARWLQKSRALVAGQRAKLFKGPDMPDMADAEPGVLQRYMDPPFLYEGRKINIRLYVGMARPAADALHLWDGGLVYISTAPYGDPDQDRKGHIVNPLLIDHAARAAPIGAFPTPTVPLLQFLEHGLPAGKSPGVRAAIHDALRDLNRRVDAASVYERARDLPGSEALPPKFFGVDMSLDADLNPIVFEIERGPGMIAQNREWQTILNNFRTDYLAWIMMPQGRHHQRFIPLG